MNSPNLDRLFNPRHVALIGAYKTFGEMGFSFLFNILRGNYNGICHPVNPREKSIIGIPCYRSVLDIPGPVDVVIITSPAQEVHGLIEQCSRKVVPNIIVCSADFSDVGQEGTALEQEVVSRAKTRGIHIVGPNSMGVFGAQTNFHGIIATVDPLHGDTSMFSQSGIKGG